MNNANFDDRNDYLFNSKKKYEFNETYAAQFIVSIYDESMKKN